LCPFQKNSDSLFILGSIQGAFLDFYLRLIKSFGIEHITATKYKCYDAGYLQVKKESGRRYPVMGEVPVLDLL
jgi:hypothetical protein